MNKKQSRFVRVVAIFLAAVMLLSIVYALIAVIIDMKHQEELDAIREQQYASYLQAMEQQANETASAVG